MKKDSLIKGILILVAIVVIGFGIMKISGSFSPTGKVIQETTSGNTVQNTESTGEIKEFKVKAFQFGFEPSTITVNKGDKVRIIAESLDVPHGFAIDEYGINLYLDGLRSKTAEFVADKAGTFTFYCNVLCGTGHRKMRGKLIVKG